MERKFLERLTSYLSTFEFLAIILIMLFAFLIRFLLVDVRPFQSDESLYTYAAYAITRGVVPYREIMLAHPPIMYLVFGVFLQLVGPNLLLFRMLNYGIFILTAFLTYLMCRVLLGREKGAKIGLLSAVLYAFYPVIVAFSLTSSAEFILTLFTLCSVISYARHSESHRKLLLLTGFFLGLALIVKFTAIFFLATLLLFHTAKTVLNKKYRVALIDTLLILAGTAIPTVSLFFVITINWNAFHHFYLNTYYVQTIRSAFSFSEKLNVLSYYTGIFSFLLITGAIGAFCLVLDTRKHRNLLSLLPAWIYGTCTIILTLLPITLPHYFLYLSPYLAFLSANSLVKIEHLLSSKSRIQLALRGTRNKLITAILLILLAFATLQTLPYISPQIEYFRTSSYTEVEAQVGTYIASKTSFYDAIWTSEPAIAFFAQRLIIAPNSSEWAFQGFFNDVFNTTYNDGHWGLGLVTPTEFIEAWEEEKIKVIVLIRGTGWVPYPDEILWNGFKGQEGVANYVNENYTLAKAINIVENPYTYEIWMRK